MLTKICMRNKRPMSLKAAYHKEQQYIWFPRYNTLYEMKGVGMPPGDPFGIHGPCHLMRLIIRNKNMYDLWMGI